MHGLTLPLTPPPIVLFIVTVNVGRAGAASLDVIQEVEYVKQEAKIIYLLECLQKTPPPVSLVVGGWASSSLGKWHRECSSHCGEVGYFLR